MKTNITEVRTIEKKQNGDKNLSNIEKRNNEKEGNTKRKQKTIGHGKKEKYNLTLKKQQEKKKERKKEF